MKKNRKSCSHTNITITIDPLQPKQQARGCEAELGGGGEVYFEQRHVRASYEVLEELEAKNISLYEIFPEMRVFPRYFCRVITHTGITT